MPGDYNGGIRIPMDEKAFIKKEQQEHPLCHCGRCWIPLWVPAMAGYIRQCPHCVFSVSFCPCSPPTGNTQYF